MHTESKENQQSVAGSEHIPVPDFRGRGRLGGGWHAYEEMKRAWVRRNPNAAPEQYERAMRQITARLGI